MVQKIGRETVKLISDPKPAHRHHLRQSNSWRVCFENLEEVQAKLHDRCQYTGWLYQTWPYLQITTNSFQVVHLEAARVNFNQSETV